MKFILRTLLLAAALATPAGSHAGSLLNDGTFDHLPAGTAPDRSTPAGSWRWPASYLSAEGKDFSEAFPSQFTIANAPGNVGGQALHSSFAASDPGPGTVLANVWSEPVTKSSGSNILVSFDVFVTPGRGGGDLFFSNGRLLETQYGPYLHLRGDVAKLYFLKPEGYLALFDYSQGVWQSVQLRIDMAQSRFDVEWRERGQNSSIVRTGMPFPGNPAFIDRLEIARNAGESVDAHYDNFRVTTDPVISPVSLDLVAGAPGTLQVVNLKEGSTIQWQRNGTDLPGATSATLELGDVTVGLAGEYTAAVTAAGQTLTTEPSTVRIHEQLVITSAPHDVKVPLGAATGFGVTATGPLPVRYQWRFNGADLPGKTNRFLNLNGVTLASEGTYTVVVSDTVHSVVSPPATLAILVRPNFTQSPLTQGVVTGGSVTFSARITGNPTPFTYQWRKGGSFATSTVVAEGTSSEKTAFLTLSNVQTADAGTYRLYVANAAAPDLLSTSPNRSFTLTVLPDTDGDGLPDEWESAHGLDPASPADALLDGDGDGLNALVEYLTGTAPTNALSVFRVETPEHADGRATLRFTAAANRTYTVDWTSAVGGGSWKKLTDVVAHGADRLETVIDTDTGEGARFYRVVTPRRP